MEKSKIVLKLTNETSRIKVQGFNPTPSQFGYVWICGIRLNLMKWE